jgi:hypothetical protein
VPFKYYFDNYCCMKILLKVGVHSRLFQNLGHKLSTCPLRVGWFFLFVLWFEGDMQYLIFTNWRHRRRHHVNPQKTINNNHPIMYERLCFNFLFKRHRIPLSVVSAVPSTLEEGSGPVATTLSKRSLHLL